jgi:ATP-dependent protease ClpP protease subunit
MDWKHIKNIDKSASFAEMFIYDEISAEKVNGSSFAYEMRHLIDYGIKTIKVKINSVGGDVMHAQTIISEIIDAKEKGVTIETYGQGLMASSAGVIWLTAEKEHRYAKDYARLMVHGVSPASQKNLDDKDKTALENFKAILVQILANRTGKKERFFEDLFTNGLDNWYSTKEMIKNGLVLKDNVENTNIKIDIEEEKTAGVVVVFNKLKTTIENNINTNQIKMKKVIALLKLQEGASEEVVEQAVVSVQNKLTEVENVLSVKDAAILALENKIAEQQRTIDTANDASAVEFVKNCIKEGKISPEKEAEVLVQAKNNLEGLKTLMSAIPERAANIINKITGEENPAEEKRSFRELEKSAPNVLNAMKKNDLKQYVNLYNTQYGTAKTEADFQ